jgi:ferrous iron transport protein A
MICNGNFENPLVEIEIYFQLDYTLLSRKGSRLRAGWGLRPYCKIKMEITQTAADSLTITDLPMGTEARVTGIKGTGRTTRRLMEMGVIPGVVVQVVKAAPFGDPIEVRVRGYSLAMRKNEADAIEVVR